MFRFPISPTSLSGMLFSSPQLRETPQSQSQQIGEKNEALNDFAANIYFSEKRIMLWKVGWDENCVKLIICKLPPLNFANLMLSPSSDLTLNISSLLKLYVATSSY